MKKVHLVGTSHIDPVWLWEWQDGYSEILATFRSALDRMKEFPELNYAASSAAFFGLVREADPGMLEEIKQRVKEGRFEIVGGWIVEPDCNMPSAEGFARQSLLGQRLFEKLLGTKTHIGYCPDSFGHCATIPKILRESEMDSYVFMRPKPHENNIPRSVFRWKADDGSEVTTFRVHINYGLTLYRNSIQRINLSVEEATKTGVPQLALFGVSNHGGGPSHDLIKAIKADWLENAEFSTIGRYFDSVRDNENMPTITGELQHHAIGCYSAHVEFKKMISECEHRLVEAEGFALMASKLAGFEYPKQRINAAWEKLLFNHFHDLIGGCSVKGAYKSSIQQLGGVLAECDAITYGAIQKIAQSINTVCNAIYEKKTERWLVWEAENHGMPIVVCNSKPYPVKSTVKMFTSATRITDSHGNDIPFQKVRGEQTLINQTGAITFVADLKPYSYEVYRAYQTAEPEVKFEPVVCDGTRLENEKLSVTFDTVSGEISSIYDKCTGRYIADKLFGTRVLDETERDTWAHDKATLGDDIGSFLGAEFTVLECGPALSTLRVKQKYGASVLTRDYTLSRESDILTVKVYLDFYEKHRAVKLKIPAQDTVIAGIPFGTVTRTAIGIEEPFGEWLSAGNLGFAATGIHGYDTADGYFSPTVLRTAIYADHFGADGSNSRDERCEHMGLGRTEFSYCLFPTYSATDSQIKCDVFNTPPRAVYSSFHEGTLPERKTLFESDAPILVSSIKMAEDSSDAVIRVYDLEGKDTVRNISLLGKKLSVELDAHSVKTLRDDGASLYFTETKKA